jgi:hypothetical protein
LPAGWSFGEGQGYAMAERQHEYWRHSPSGEVWAVEIHDGQLAGCCGPIDADGIDPQLLPNLPYDRRDVAWLQTHAVEFKRLIQFRRPHDGA